MELTAAILAKAVMRRTRCRRARKTPSPGAGIV